MKGKRGPSGFGGALVDEARKQGVATEGQSVKQAEQQELLKRDGAAPVTSVQGEKFLARFTKTIFDKKKDERIVQIELSVELTDAHKDLLDANILNAVKFAERNHIKGVSGIEIPNQTFDVYLAPETDSELHLVAAEVRNVNVSTVKAKGDGKARDILGLSFRVLAPAMKDATRFATTEYGEPVWVKMAPAQGRLEESAA